MTMRVEHEDHANTHGQAVGANMAGAGEPYDHLPLFYSDLFDLGYEAVGQVDSRLETVEDGRSRAARASSRTSRTAAARRAALERLGHGRRRARAAPRRSRAALAV